MTIYYVMMPYVFDEIKRKKTLPLSFVWADCTKDAEEIRNVCKKVQIRLIAPNQSFDLKVISD